jgi:hypothetical protein
MRRSRRNRKHSVASRPAKELPVPVVLDPFALLTLRVARDGQVVETDLLEMPK